MKKTLSLIRDCIGGMKDALNELKEITKDHENRLKKLEGE